jgi:predicted small lipoprotein YifL
MAITMKNIVPILIAVVFLLPGCGKKGPPIPPRQKPIPAVSDLKYIIDDDILTLTWTIPREKDRAKTAFNGFIVYRSKRPNSDSTCKNCPKLFQKVSDIPADITTDATGYKDKKIEYREEIEKGFVYTYKVVLYTKSGVFGTDSNHVDFNY